jgi:hypothetical protein
MSFIKITPDLIETFTLRTNPTRTFNSSSVSGPTGSLYVFARRSDIEKQDQTFHGFDENKIDENNATLLLENIKANVRSSSNFKNKIDKYLDVVNSLDLAEKNTKYLEIDRFVPPFDFNKNSLKKSHIRKVLNPYYRNLYKDCNFAYTNYLSLNFFTASSVTNQACLIYPDDLNVENYAVINNTNKQLVNGNYVLPSSWSFDFHINPRYQNDKIDVTKTYFNDGTILHLSGCYAVSLVSGSSRDGNNRCDKFRIKLQLSHSAGYQPSLSSPGNFPHDLTFLSDDNSLNLNEWHHVVIRWGTSKINNGTGSFVIDGTEKGYFVIPSSSLMPLKNAINDPAALFVGNYYKGNNSGLNQINYFFTTDVAEREGLRELIVAAGDKPSVFSFTNQLNAEIHDVSIKTSYMSDGDIENSAIQGPSDFDNTVFYLPPYFITSSSYRKYVGSHGGILQTPFYVVDGTTDDPYNVALAYGVGGHYMNLENFVYDFASANRPRLMHLSFSVISTTTDVRTANSFLNDNGITPLRNLLILPCDDGKFLPNYKMIENFGINNKVKDDLGGTEYSYISLNDIISTSSIVKQLDTQTSGSFFESLIGSTPEDPGTQLKTSYTVLQRTRDNSSNEIVIFNISNLFYGNRILPGSFTITDNALTGSDNKVQITLKDNGLGNLYRANANSVHPTWCSVGNIYYDEGLVVIKDPSLYFFGKDYYEMSFKGDQNIHMMKFNIFAGANQFNSSSNSTYNNFISASSYANDKEQSFVYITNINYHDDNFNVVAKTNLAQPLMKRDGEKFLIRTKLDW